MAARDIAMRDWETISASDWASAHGTPNVDYEPGRGFTIGVAGNTAAQTLEVTSLEGVERTLQVAANGGVAQINGQDALCRAIRHETNLVAGASLIIGFPMTRGSF